MRELRDLRRQHFPRITYYLYWIFLFALYPVSSVILTNHVLMFVCEVSFFDMHALFYKGTEYPAVVDAISVIVFALAVLLLAAAFLVRGGDFLFFLAGSIIIGTVFGVVSWNLSLALLVSLSSTILPLIFSFVCLLLGSPIEKKFCNSSRGCS